MSYPSQPSYTPPYGQPQPPRQTNLWLVGGTLVLVVAIVLAVVLIIFQRANESTEGSGGDPDTTSEAAPTDDGDETTDDGDDGGDDTGGSGDGGDTGGDTGGEFAGFSESTCGAFDMGKYEELFSEAPDPSQSYTSASSSGNTGSMTCSYYNSDYDSSTLSVMAWSDAEAAMDWWEGDKEYLEADSGYVITDYPAVGDAGYHEVFGEGDIYQKRAVGIVVGAVQIDVEVWIYPDEHDADVADEYLQSLAEQAATMFADYA